jgi:hypothetical protein
MITRLTFIIIGIVLSTSCRNTVNKTPSRDDFESAAFEKRFPLKNLKSFNLDSIYRLVAGSSSALDPVLIKKLIPDSIINGPDSVYLCSVQNTEGAYKAYIFLFDNPEYTALWWIDYDRDMKPIDALLLESKLEEEGSGSSVNSKLIKPGTIEKTSKIFDIIDYEEGHEFKTFQLDSSIEIIKIMSNGKFRNESKRTYHKEHKLKNQNYIPKPGSTGKK